MVIISTWHLIILVVVAVLIVFPFWRILPRSGIPAPVALVALIPLGAFVLLWVMAFKRWPEDN